MVLVGSVVLVLGVVEGTWRVDAATTRLPAATLWVARSGCEKVARVNPAGRVVARVDVGCQVITVADGAGAVWFGTDRGSVVRVDPVSNEVVATIDVGSRASAIAVGARDVWVSDVGTHEVVRIDAASNTVTARIPVGSDEAPVVGLALDGETPWAIEDFALALVRIDPATNAVSGRVSLCAAEECRVGSAAVGESRAWVIDCCSGEVLEIDPVTLAVTDNATLGRGVWELTGDDESVWALHQDLGRLVRLEPGRAEPTEVIKTKARGALYPELGADSVWFFATSTSEIIRVPVDTEKIVSRVKMTRVLAFAVNE